MFLEKRMRKWVGYFQLGTLSRSGRLLVRATPRIAGFASLRAVARRFSLAWGAFGESWGVFGYRWGYLG